MKKSYRGQYAVSKKWQIDYSDLATDPYITIIKGTVLNQALREHPNTTESDWEIEYKIQDDVDKPFVILNVQYTMKSQPSYITINLNKPSRNTLTPQQTRALTALWEKWREGSNQIAYSPYGAPYISIERRDHASELGSWDWCITYHSEYDSQVEWYSHSKQPMPTEIRNFLRKAWDREFASIHQTNL